MRGKRNCTDTNETQGCRHNHNRTQTQSTLGPRVCRSVASEAGGQRAEGRGERPRGSRRVQEGSLSVTGQGPGPGQTQDGTSLHLSSSPVDCSEQLPSAGEVQDSTHGTYGTGTRSLARQANCDAPPQPIVPRPLPCPTWPSWACWAIGHLRPSCSAPPLQTLDDGGTGTQCW